MFLRHFPSRRQSAKHMDAALKIHSAAQHDKQANQCFAHSQLLASERFGKLTWILSVGYPCLLARATRDFPC
jgi:hypothetical protein